MKVREEKKREEERERSCALPRSHGVRAQTALLEAKPKHEKRNQQ